jgi:hypothetical protein
LDEVAAAAGGVNAALEAGEGFGALDGDFAEAMGFGDGTEAVGNLVVVEGGFDFAEAAGSAEKTEDR